MLKKISLVLAIIALTGCTTQIKDNPPANKDANATSTDSGAKTEKLREKNTIEIIQSQFLPNTYIIKPGTTIKWVNRENTPHIIRSQGNFQSPVLKKDEAFSFTFEKAGEYVFDCAIHTYMKGRISVEE